MARFPRPSALLLVALLGSLGCNGLLGITDVEEDPTFRRDTGAGGSLTGGAGGSSGQAGEAGARGDECETSKQCHEQLGEPALCRNGYCVALTSKDCLTFVGDPDQDTDQVMGLMVPGPDDTQSLGPDYVAAVQLAFDGHRFDIKEAGLKPSLVIVCDESTDPERAVDHLLTKVGVKLIIGPTLEQSLPKVLPLLQAAGAISMLPFHAEASFEELPHQDGQLWSCHPNDGSKPRYWESLMKETESLVRSHYAIENFQVTVVVGKQPQSKTLADSLLPRTNINGKPAADNIEAGYLRRVDQDKITEKNGFIDYAKILSGPAPHLIVILLNDGFEVLNLPPNIELNWTYSSKGPNRPYYLFVDGGETLRSLGEHASGDEFNVVDRLLNVGPALSSVSQPARLKFEQDLHEVSALVSPSDAAYFYDCFCAADYASRAAISVGGLTMSQLDGVTFASKGIRSIASPGEELYTVGGDDASAVLGALLADRMINIEGISSSLDFDLDRGTPQVNGALECLGPPTDFFHDFALTVSGLEFSPVTGKAVGTNSNCQ